MEKKTSRNEKRSLTTVANIRKPAFRVPQFWQSVIEQQFNMIKTQQETVFVPGRISRTVFPGSPCEHKASTGRLASRNQLTMASSSYQKLPEIEGGVKNTDSNVLLGFRHLDVGLVTAKESRSLLFPNLPEPLN